MLGNTFISLRGSSFRVPDAVQRSLRCTAEPGSKAATCEAWTPDQQRTTPQDRARRDARERAYGAAQHPGNAVLHHHAHPLCRARNAGAEPPGPAVLERKPLVEH